ncbi:DUF2974 domain-containing protein [Scytonema sp. UIC 10036]|uniref:lipase family protein n=1 Tax=Scytonema sp. UIC 10036 TaxID=2304196 RepID=UPI0012DAC7A4|nr:Mbeg1-like protein [Scytonema sp. UIC 10036]MUG91358.1 DUF2974 domain-containing protein [Scytonema sp. UIC 10036]
MVRINRRQVLLAGLATGVATNVTTDYLRTQAARDRQAKLETLADAQLNSEDLLKASFASDLKTINEGREIRAALKLQPPKINYDRGMSKLIIQCSKLATQQYLKGNLEKNYDGSLESLPAYSDKLKVYSLFSTFKGKEDVVEETVAVRVPVDEISSTTSYDQLKQKTDIAKNNVIKTVQEFVKRKRQVPVYLGFTLLAKTHSIIVFRGTQKTVEWIHDFTAFQDDYPISNSNQTYGKVHRGFATFYRNNLQSLVREVIKRLNPFLPCYICGHSLGAALATLAAIDIALNFPQHKPNLRLYTYASPRVGDPVFAQTHSQLIPNSYRIVNLADTIPLVPPTKIGGVYVHVGQEWSFLSQNGDLLPNHIVETYRVAVDGEAENQSSNNYTNLGVV